MKERQNSKLKQIWNDKRGKAFLKLCGWFCFLLFIALFVSIIGKKPEKESIIPNETSKSEWKELYIMFDDFLNNNYRYEYRITELESKEMITYSGEKQNDMDTGFRESKIGIIKYKIKDEITYQILMDQEEIIEHLYQEEDLYYIDMNHIKEMISVMPKDESEKNHTRLLTYQDEEKKIIIETDEKNITKIQINTNKKEYILNYKF